MDNGITWRTIAIDVSGTQTSIEQMVERYGLHGYLSDEIIDRLADEDIETCQVCGFWSDVDDEGFCPDCA